MNNDEKELEILYYYVGGKTYNPIHNKEIIRQLMAVDYLRHGITHEFKDYYRTTDYGLIYLDLFGYDVKTPVIKDGRIIKSAEGEAV